MKIELNHNLGSSAYEKIHAEISKNISNKESIKFIKSVDIKKVNDSTSLINLNLQNIPIVGNISTGGTMEINDDKVIFDFHIPLLARPFVPQIKTIVEEAIKNL